VSLLHPFTDEISENEITFLDTVVFKGEKLKKESILDIKAHYKPTETFQYTHFNSCHPPGMKNGFIKGIGINTKEKGYREDFAFCYATYHPAVNNLKQTLMEQWSLIQNQPLLKTIYLKSPMIIDTKEVNL